MQGEKVGRSHRFCCVSIQLLYLVFAQIGHKWKEIEKIKMEMEENKFTHLANTDK